MLNQLFLIGEIKELPDKDNVLVIGVKRNYKNTNGVFEEDVFKCYLWIAMSKRINMSCKIGDLIALKGRIVEDGGVYCIVAEQVVLLNKYNNN